MSFSTLKFSETGETQVLKTTDNPRDYQQNKHEACTRCHEKKLRCNGNKDGCERCAASGLRCEYSRSGSRQVKKGKATDMSSSSRSTKKSAEGKGSKAAHNTQPSSASKSKSSRGTKGSSNSAPLAPTSSVNDCDMYRPKYPSHGLGNGQGGYSLDDVAASTAVQYPGYPTGTMQLNTGLHESYSNEWTLQGASTSSSIPAGYVATSEAFYGHDHVAYSDFSQETCYDAYQNDPRFWNRGHH